jgi:hypothetical protein
VAASSVLVVAPPIVSPPTRLPVASLQAESPIAAEKSAGQKSARDVRVQTFIAAHDTARSTPGEAPENELGHGAQ